jgi:capsular polysaccharide biosynthesis protein
VPVEAVPRRFAPEGVAYPGAWDAIMVLSIANLLVALAVGLFFAGLGYANVMRQPTRYASHATLLIDQPLQITKGDSGVVVKLSLLRGKYVALINTGAIIQPAAQKANLPAGEVRAAQRPQYAPNTLTINALAQSGDPVKAQRIAQATAEALSEYVQQEQAATGLPPVERISVRVVQPAGIGTKVSPVSRRALQVAAVAGAAGVLIAYVGLQLRSARRQPLG